MDALDRTDDTQNRLTRTVRRAAETTVAPRGYRVEIHNLGYSDETDAFRILCHTHVVRGICMCLRCNQVTSVLGHPAGRTEVRARHHDGGGQRNPTHGARHLIYPARLQDMPQASTVYEATPHLMKIAILRCAGQTQMVAAGSGTIPFPGTQLSCATRQREVLLLNNHTIAKIRSKIRTHIYIQLFVDLLMIRLQTESDY